MTSVIDPEDLLESTQVQELNGLITTTITAPYSQELERAFYVGSRDIDDNNIFWMYKVDKRSKENNNIVLNGTYVLFDELKAYDIIRDKRPANVSALSGITTILEGSRWQLGSNTSTHLGTANWYYISRLEAFWEYLENWRVEFKPRMTFSQGQITGRYIDIMDKRSADYGKWYEYGDKLLDIKAEQASDSLYTAFVGRGKGEEIGAGYGRRLGFNSVTWTIANGKPVDKPLNQDFVEIPSATALYGYSDGKPRTTVVVFEDIEDPVQLLEQTYEYALEECRPKLQLRADVLETQLSELGETCTIIRDDIGIRYKTRVFKLTRNFLNKNQKTVEFGDEIVQSTAQRNNNTAKIIKKQEQQVIAWMDSLQQELLDSYFNEDGYNYDLKAGNEYDLPGGFYSFNAPIDQNPTKLIYMGAGTLAIANGKLPNGQWDFRTWGTGDGFTADLINAGVMRGAFMEHNLNVGESVYTDPVTRENLRFKQGQIIFERDGQIRYLNYNAEGLQTKPDPSNTGTSLNSSFYLIGGGVGSHQYLHFDSGAGVNQRISALDNNITVLVGANGRLIVREYGQGSRTGGVDANDFRTVADANGSNLQMIANTIKAPSFGSHDIYIKPQGTGIVQIGDGTNYFNIKASTFLNASSRTLKDNINETEIHALEALDSLTVVDYDLIKDIEAGIENRQTGFIAEDSRIISDKEGKSIDSYKLATFNTKAIQELNAENKLLKQELQSIKHQLGLS